MTADKTLCDSICVRALKSLVKNIEAGNVQSIDNSGFDMNFLKNDTVQVIFTFTGQPDSKL